MPKVNEHNKIELSFNFRRLAWGYVGTFLLTMIVGAIVTFTATYYDPKTDFIYKYYDTFNPCIFFDHEPSSYVTSFLIALMAIIGILCKSHTDSLYLFDLDCYAERSISILTLSVSYWVLDSLGIFIVLVKESNIQYIILGAFFTAFMVAAEAMFVNVFTSNIYVHVDEANLNATAPLTDDDMHEIWFHTMWYVLYLILHVIGMMFMLHVSPILSKQATTLKGYVLWGIGFFGLALGTSGLVLALTLGEEGRKLGLAYSKLSTFKYVILWCHKHAKTALWHWVPVFCYRFIVDANLGLKLTFSQSTLLAKDRGVAALRDLHTLEPGHFFDSAFGVLAALLFGSLLMDSPYIEGRETVLPVAAGFRELPYSFLFAPTWLILSIVIAIGVVTTVIREKLINGGESSLRINIMETIGFFFTMCFTACFWIVIPQWKGSQFVTIPMLILLPIWVLVVSASHLNWRPILWSVLFVTAAGLALKWEMAALGLLVLLMLYRQVTPDLHQLHVEVEVVRNVVESKHVEKSSEMTKV